MQVQARAVDTKRHTIGWKIGGKWRTRSEAVDLARSGKIDGVKISRVAGRTYISGRHGSLYSLPTRVEPSGNLEKMKRSR